MNIFKQVWNVEKVKFFKDAKVQFLKSITPPINDILKVFKQLKMQMDSKNATIQDKESIEKMYNIRNLFDQLDGEKNDLLTFSIRYLEWLFDKESKKPF